jgi:hypothetical protein
VWLQISNGTQQAAFAAAGLPTDTTYFSGPDRKIERLNQFI